MKKNKKKLIIKEEKNSIKCERYFLWLNHYCHKCDFFEKCKNYLKKNYSALE